VATNSANNHDLTGAPIPGGEDDHVGRSRVIHAVTCEPVPLFHLIVKVGEREASEPRGDGLSSKGEGLHDALLRERAFLQTWKQDGCAGVPIRFAQGCCPACC
jgi:hypothetical protein